MKATSLVKSCHAPWKNQGNFFCPSQEILTGMSGCFVRGFHGLQRCVLLLKYNLMYVLNSL